MTSSERAGRPRVAPVLLPDSYEPPEAPAPSAPATVQDTFRQTRFLLSDDLKTFRRAMELQLRLQHESYPSRYRSHTLAALTLFWSRAYAALRDAALLLTRGSYPSIPHLVRSASECIGVQGQLRGSEMDVYESWLENSFLQAPEYQALDINLGRYRAAGILATDAVLGQTYRIVSDLSMTPFGGSLFLSAPESNQQRILVAFADQAFHAGYAELMMGWLLVLCERQLAFAEAASEIFNVSKASVEESRQIRVQASEALNRPGRCSSEEVLIDGERRYLIHNFRRAASGAPKKILL